MLIGSAINIWYNVTNVDPLLTADQRDALEHELRRASTAHVAFRSPQVL
jgi:hypothetical protein